MTRRASRLEIEARPATAARWDDLLEVFGPRGAYCGCWCMYWRVKRTDFVGMGVEGRRAALRGLTRTRQPPGLLFYDLSAEGGPLPFGWCSLGPREEFSVLSRSPVLKPVDDRPTWSLICFFMTEPYRGRGLFRRLLVLALDHARERGAKRIEAYPREKHRTGTWAYMGVAEVYRSLGFVEIARRKADRPVLRLELRRGRRAKSARDGAERRRAKSGTGGRRGR